jgi:DNA-binding beta-propeller fold protein YncE
MQRRHFLLGGAAAFVTGCGPKTKGFAGYVFVANEGGQAVAVVDLAAFTLLTHVRLEGSPTAVITHPTEPAVYALTPLNGTIHQIDAGTMKLVRKVQVAPSALAMRLSPDRSALWVLCRESRKMIRVNLDTFTASAQVALPMDPVDFDIEPYQGALCGISFGETGVAGILDFSTGKVAAIPIGGPIGTVRFRSDGKALVVSRRQERMLTLLQTPGGRVIVHLPLAVTPEHLCFNQDGGQLFITGEGRDAVVVVYPHHVPLVAETALAGRAPGAMGASSEFLFVANPLTGDVSIFHIGTRKVIAVAAVGAEPCFIAVTPNDQYALVLNRRSGDMAVIRLGAIKANNAKSVGLFTMIPVGSSPVSAVVRTV